MSNWMSPPECWEPEAAPAKPAPAEAKELAAAETDRGSYPNCGHAACWGMGDPCPPSCGHLPKAETQEPEYEAYWYDEAYNCYRYARAA